MIFDKTFVKKYNWIAETDFWYRKKFNIDLDILSGDTELIFEGIDCFATIWLNGQKIAETHNALIWHNLKVAPKLLRKKNNELIVKISSTVNTLLNSDPKIKLECHEEYMTKESHSLGMFIGRGHIRKSYPSFYLGFKNAFLTPTGIWREVKLISYPKVKIENVWAKTRILELDNKKIARAELDIEIELNGNIEKEGISFDLKLLDKEGKTVFKKRKEVKEKSTNIKKVLREIHPWYPHNIGEPYLYNLKVTLTDGAKTLDYYEDKIGFRNIELVLEEKGKNRYYFKINKERVVLKGATLFLLDYFQFRETKSKYKEALEKMKKANMNIVVLLGSDIYKEKSFFHICDQLGIMVSHSFVCWNTVDLNGFVHLQKELKEEAEKVIRRFRNHPSIICFVGGVETYGYSYINWTLLRDACKSLVPYTPYVPADPWSPPGTVSKKDMEWIRKNHGLDYYCKGGFKANPTTLEWISPASGSTEGFTDRSLMSINCANNIGLPTLKTLRETCSEKKIKELMYRFLEGKSNLVYPRKKILPPFMHNNLDLSKMEDVVLLSDLFGSHRVKTDIEYFRRRKECGGGVLCAFNTFLPDIWHGEVDYYLRRKGCYYFAKRAYENLLIMVYGKPLPHSLNFHGGYHFSSFLVHGEPKKEVWIVNDYREKLKGKLTVAQYSFSGKERWKEEREIVIAPASTRKLYKFLLDEKMLKRRCTDFVLVRFNSDKGLQAKNTYFIGEFKELKLPQVKLDISQKKINEHDGYIWLELKIKANKYASIVRIQSMGEDMDDIDVSDNYFDICPDEIVKVEVKIVKGEKVCIQAFNSKRVYL